MSRPCATPERACPATTDSTESTTTTDSVVESTPSPARATRDEEEDDDDALADDSSPLLGRLARVTLSDATNDATRAIGGVHGGKPVVGGFGVKKRCANDRRGVVKTIDSFELDEPSRARAERDDRLTTTNTPRRRSIRRFHSPTDSTMSPASKFVARKAHHHAVTSGGDKFRAAPRPGDENVPPPSRLAASRFRPLE